MEDKSFTESKIQFTVIIFFVLATLIIMVLMFNILIAVVCSIYEEVIAMKDQAIVYERICLYDELRGQMNALYGIEVNQQTAKRQYLTVAKVLTSQGNSLDSNAND